MSPRRSSTGASTAQWGRFAPLPRLRQAPHRRIGPQAHRDHPLDELHNVPRTLRVVGVLGDAGALVGLDAVLVHDPGHRRPIAQLIGLDLRRDAVQGQGVVHDDAALAGFLDDLELARARQVHPAFLVAHAFLADPEVRRGAVWGEPLQPVALNVLVAHVELGQLPAHVPDRREGRRVLGVGDARQLLLQAVGVALPVAGVVERFRSNFLSPNLGL